MEFEKRKDELIDLIKKKPKQSITEQELFTIRWNIFNIYKRHGKFYCKIYLTFLSIWLK
jgi:hypothetical protein